MPDHQDILDSLNRNLPLREKLIQVHDVLNDRLSFIARIAIAIYDPKTTLLKTFLHSEDGEDPLSSYQAPLSEAPSLEAILREGRPRVINNLITFEKGSHEHTRRIGRHGYSASYTMPMFSNGVFFGFVFFNSYESDVFTDDALKGLDVFGHMISFMVISELATLRTLVAAVTMTARLTHLRSPETGTHLDRMSRYARMIARALAPRYRLDDEYIEHVFMFSPMHDIGKIAIPDNILLKQGTLDPREAAVMRSHVQHGREMVDDLLKNFGLDSIEHANVLRNIAEFHHEAVNGKGYPNGLRGDEIPLEARIVATADVFDALTSRRSYKDAWSNDEAFATLQRLAGEKLDAECVRALIENRTEVERIQALFQEESVG